MQKLGLLIALGGLFVMVAAPAPALAARRHHQVQVVKTRTSLGYRHTVSHNRASLPEWGKAKAAPKAKTKAAAPAAAGNSGDAPAGGAG